MSNNPLSGMNEQPGQSYSIASRLTCAKCGVTPTIIRAEGRDPVVLDVTCHGAKESRAIPKSELTFQQFFFNDEADV